MKRINLIVKGKGVIDSLLNIREKKILRAVESAADYAEEKQLDAEADALKAIEEMGKVADDSDRLSVCINNYCDALTDKEEWKKKAEQIAALKVALNETVENVEEK